MKEYSKFDAVGLAELVEMKKVSSDELLEAAISGVEEINPSINAVVLKMYDEAISLKQLPNSMIALSASKNFWNKLNLLQYES